MAKPDLFYKIQPRMLAQSRRRLRDLEHGTHDIVAAVPQIPKLLQSFHRLVDLTLETRFDHRLDFDRVRGVDNTEDVFAGDEPEARSRGLQVVDCLPHIPLSAEDERRKAVVTVLYILRGRDGEEALGDLFVREARVAEDGAAGLEGLDDLVALIAGEGEARRGAVDFHCSTQSLLRAGGHAIGFVEDD